MSEIDKDFAKAEDLIFNAAEEVIRATGIKLTSAVIIDTPVITGRLRGNWRTTLEQLRSGGTIREDREGLLAMTEAENTFAQFNLGDTVTFYNSLDYAIHVEEGTENQAGQFMMKRNIRIFKQAIERAARKHEVK